MGAPITYLVAMAGAATLWIASIAATFAFGRRYIARIPFDWRADERFREPYEAYLQNRTWDEARNWNRSLLAWGLSIFAAAVLFSASEFSARFMLISTACLIVYLTVALTRDRWDDWRESELAYSTGGRPIALRLAAATFLTFLYWAAFVAFFAVAGVGLGDALSG